MTTHTQLTEPSLSPPIRKGIGREGKGIPLQDQVDNLTVGAALRAIGLGNG
jgi:hypothetical protein